MSRRIAVLFVFATALSALTCARTPPERQLIRRRRRRAGRRRPHPRAEFDCRGRPGRRAQRRTEPHARQRAAELESDGRTAHVTDLANDRTDMTQTRQAAVPVRRRAGAAAAPGAGRRRGRELPAQRPAGAGHRGAGDATAAARRCTTRWPPCGPRSPRPPAHQPAPGRRQRRGRRAHVARRRHPALRLAGHEAAGPRGDARRAPQSGRRRDRHGVQRLRGRERREDAEAPHHHHRQVPAVRSARVEEHGGRQSRPRLRRPPP